MFNSFVSRKRKSFCFSEYFLFSSAEILVKRLDLLTAYDDLGKTACEIYTNLCIGNSNKLLYEGVVKTLTFDESQASEIYAELQTQFINSSPCVSDTRSCFFHEKKMVDNCDCDFAKALRSNIELLGKLTEIALEIEMNYGALIREFTEVLKPVLDSNDSDVSVYLPEMQKDEGWNRFGGFVKSVVEKSKTARRDTMKLQ